MTDISTKKMIAIETLTGFATGLLQAGGFSPAHARQTADLLVWANARGIDSHGVLRIPRYIELAQGGQINVRSEPRIVSAFGAMSIIEADDAPGAAAMNMAMDHAVELAGQLAIGWCSARNISHAGAVGYFAERATRRGCIGIVMTASTPLMTYHGSSAEALSTNPLAIAAPGADGAPPIILDMSTSAAAYGKIMAAKEAGRSIPNGWGIDANGADTTDPNAVKTLLPMAGAKGSGLSLMIEVLGSILVANPVLVAALRRNGPVAFNGIAIALDIKAFGDIEAFRSGMSELAGAIKALPAASGFEGVYLPGERSAAAGLRAAATGVPVESATASRLVALARQLGIEAPPELQ